MEKPYRFLLGPLAGYAEEASAFLRRRRVRQRPFARVWWAPGRGVGPDHDSEAGGRLLAAATALIELTDEGSTSSPGATRGEERD